MLYSFFKLLTRSLHIFLYSFQPAANQATSRQELFWLPEVKHDVKPPLRATQNWKVHLVTVCSGLFRRLYKDVGR